MLVIRDKKGKKICVSGVLQLYRREKPENQAMILTKKPNILLFLWLHVLLKMHGTVQNNSHIQVPLYKRFVTTSKDANVPLRGVKKE